MLRMAMDPLTIAMLGQFPPAAPRAAFDGTGATLTAGSVQLPALHELYDAGVDAYRVRPAGTGIRPCFPPLDSHPLRALRELYDAGVEAYLVRPAGTGMRPSFPPPGFHPPQAAHAAPVSYGGGAAFTAGSMVLPLPHEIYGAGVNASVRPEVGMRVRLPLPACAAPVYDGATGFTESINTRPKEQAPPCDEPYEQDIDDYVRAMEKDARQRPSPDYMSATQTEVNQGMRAILICWLDNVAQDCKLAPGTLHRAVSYVDRFMSKKPVRRSDLHLLGAASIFLAAKYEDNHTKYVLDANRLVALTDHSYTKDEVLAMEVDVLKTLGYEMSGPTAHTFLERFTSGHDGVLFRSWARQLAELALLDYGSIRFLPSVVAASAVFVARLMLNRPDPPWNKGLRELTGYMLPDLLGCVALMYVMDVDWGIPFLSTSKMKERYMKILQLLPDKNAIPVLYRDDP